MVDRAMGCNPNLKKWKKVVQQYEMLTKRTSLELIRAQVAYFEF